MAEWYFTRAGETCGPVTPDKLRRLLAKGEITVDTQVWCPADNVEPEPVSATFFANATPPAAGPQWHYERAGTRVGPVDEAEFERLVATGTITRDTLVWSPAIGSAFKRLSDTAFAPPMSEPPQLPASAVDNSLAWILVAIPLVSAILEQFVGQQSTSIWGWPLVTLIANLAISALDERRVIRSGVADKSIRLGFWIWLVPVYLFQRARALKGPKYYVYGWLASFVASLFVAAVDLSSLIGGDTYLGAGVPACDSRYEMGQVKKVFESIGQVKAAGLTSVNVTNVRELGTSGMIRTCAAQINASNAQSYRAVFTVERTDEQILTNLQLGQ